MWIDGQAAIERAAWISDLIRVYGRMESAYLPLWLLGYPILLKRVRKALRQPTADLNQAIRKEMKWNLFHHASFIKEHLSFERMKETLRHCTVDDLKIIERDLGILREIVFYIGRMVKAMVSAVSAEFTKGFTDKWRALFFVGRMRILAGLSLRRSGHGDWIDKNMQLGLDVIREGCNEEREAELRANSPKLFADMQTSIEELKRTLAPRSAAAPERRAP